MKLIHLLHTHRAQRRARQQARREERAERAAHRNVQISEHKGELYLTISGTPLLKISTVAHGAPMFVALCEMRNAYAEALLNNENAFLEI